MEKNNSFDKIFTVLAVFGIIVGSLAVIKIFDISYPLTITTTTKSTELAVVGEGKTEAVPDTAYVDVGITVQAPTVEAAKKEIDDVNNKIVSSMKELGIEKKDIKTSNYSVNPNYKYANNENTISGYNGNASLTIKVINMRIVTDVVNKAADSGANLIQGTRFEVGSPEKYRKEARDKAIENAKEQAEELARTLGIRLGKIVNIVESSPNSPMPILYNKMSATVDGRGGGGPEIEPGIQTVESTVTLYFEKK